MSNHYLVFSPLLAAEVLRYPKTTGFENARVALENDTGRDPLGWGTSIQQGLAASGPGQLELVVPQDSFFSAENPGTIREPEGGPETYTVPATPEQESARQALYDSTRLLMVASPDDDLTSALFRAACTAWRGQLAAEPDIKNYSTGVELLAEIELIWSGKQKKGAINLRKRAQLPPFFDGNTQMVELMIQSPYLECDYAAFGRLPELRHVVLCTEAGQEAIEAHDQLLPKLAKLLPKLTQRGQKEVAPNVVYTYLTAAQYTPDLM